MKKFDGLKDIAGLSAYELIGQREIEDIGSMGAVLRHKKTGARIALLANDDENKVFYIGFRTPPSDSTGVAHILEHSVLCGSEHFPVKDPFVELVKGSLNTFLNAMTYPDKTLYPVASCNDKDFQNLMHVYLDAVFYPNIYRNESIFRQEGWHYERNEETGKLEINGVVYNEMKGAYSSADDVLETTITNALYPNTAYGVESGGDPDVIPKLSYEEFLDFHRKYYHPSNSYIYLYGDMDMAEKLRFIDEQYLASFDKLPVDSEIAAETDTRMNGREVVKEYPLNDGESAEDNTYLSLNYSVGASTDKKLCVAFQILDYALCSAPGAPLKKTLIERGIGKDVYSYWESGIKQPYFSVVAKGTEKKQEFLDTVTEVLEKIAAEGFDKKALLAALNYYEFKYREADFESYPKGLMYGLQMLDEWLYDDQKVFDGIELLDTYRELRAEAENGYYEKLIERYLLQNEHRAFVVLKPVEGLLEKKEKELEDRLEETKNAMSEKEAEAVDVIRQNLREFQEREDAPEDLAKIPLLKREDLKKEAAKLVCEERQIADTKLLYHAIETNGIGYFRLIFSLDAIPEAYFNYVGLFKSCLGLLNTEHYSYGDLFNEINLATGGMAAVNNVYSRIDDPDRFRVTLEIKTKAFYGQLGRALELMREIMLTSDFADEKRLKEILSEARSRVQSQMMAGGHSVAAGRALSYGSVSGAVSETISGVPFYRLLADLEEHFDERKKELTTILTNMVKMVFRPENLMLDFIGEEKAIFDLEEDLRGMKSALFTEEVEKGSYRPLPVPKKEGFMTAGQIQYVCRAGNYAKKGLPYTGALRVLRVMMGYEYLWTNIRVKGGAYGCMCRFGRSGESYFVSYRDPNLKKTIDVYEKAAEAIERYEADERTITQYIIGAISDMDVPMNPATKGMLGMGAYMTGLDDAFLQRERDEVLSVTDLEIRRLADYIRAFMEDEYLCVVGNAVNLRREEAMFTKLENLF